MSNILISYGDKYFARSLKRIGKEAKKTGRFNRIILYTPDDLPIAVKASPLFCFAKGGGYWLWKPYIIHKTLSLCNEGDVVYYVDAGCSLRQGSDEWDTFEQIMKEKNGLFFQYRSIRYEGWEQFCSASENNNAEIYHWMKPSVLQFFNEYIGGLDFMHYNKIWGGLIAIKKCRSMKIIDEWLNITLFYPELIIDPFGHDLTHLPESFNVHRHDQSILTPLVFYYKDKEDLCVIFETSESEQEKAAVVASRKKDRIRISFWERLKNKIDRMRRGE